MYEIWAITNNLHSTKMPKTQPKFDLVMDQLQKVFLFGFYSAPVQEPVRSKSCYDFLAGTERIPVRGVRNFSDSS